MAAADSADGNPGMSYRLFLVQVSQAGVDQDAPSRGQQRQRCSGWPTWPPE